MESKKKSTVDKSKTVETTKHPDIGKEKIGIPNLDLKKIIGCGG